MSASGAIDAVCDPGDTVIGGGWFGVGGTVLDIVASRPTDAAGSLTAASADRWRVGAASPGSDIRVYAICVDQE